jgi:hypothetical protein
MSALAVAGLTRIADSQEPRIDLRRDHAPRVVAPPRPVTPSDLTMTPEMWFYEQERSRQDDPTAAVRRRAEARAQQRQARLASSEWYGLSNSRPVCNLTPWCSNYSAYWGSNTFDPLRFRPVATVVMRPTDGPQ